ncbi:hypothetical protein HXX76_014978 [Chlamydomonas incerta]|uniref:pullulanase n=1 Tax=Chlamydomonas incerta TaxID=51695 RepID=A0A835SAP8_CHLIN|nr:hypothetical protein HXX76_014978 [Chlamydomonas incerta]|eukprot:KAG2423818.1 hypothetical protein HXX76_014978 [Chlamydomonas incerta]
MLAQKHCGIKQQHRGSLRKLVPGRNPARNNFTFGGAQSARRLGLEDSASFSQWVSGQSSTAIFRPVACASAAADSAPSVDPGVLIIHYVRKDHNYKGWGLHVWGDSTRCTQWQQPLKPTRVTDRELVWELPLRAGARRVGALVHKGEQKAASGEVVISAHGSTMSVDQATGTAVQEAWLVGSEQSAFPFPPDMSRIPAGSINKQAAHWVSPGLLLWRQAAADGEAPRRFRLHYSRAGHMHITGAGVQGADASWDLDPQPPAAASPGVKRFPHLYGCTALAVPPEAGAAAGAAEGGIVAGQLLVSVHDAAGDALDATGVQIQGLLDELLTYDGPLGDHPDPSGGGHRITLWAPTAQKVELLHWGAAPRGGQPQVYPMARGAAGSWSLARPAGWLWSYYTYRVTVYCPWTARVETVESTDPYSRGLAADGARTQIVDLEHPDTMPGGWHAHAPPALAQWTDISVYELHVRDFSMTDAAVPPPLRGKYLAFVPERVAAGGGGGGGGGLSAGLAHLAALRAAGLNHLHLLPTYDFATVPERAEDQRVVQEDLTRHPPDSPQQQAAVLAVADNDGFNWGYDPVHYGVPEGSYATDPDGIARIREFREMVQSLHGQGWRVVQDVVYNHTFASGPHSRYSVLDKVVPGYYHRRHEDGGICDSTCCNNTATEHAMCERLVVDDITHWARNYKVDGFRFDIMGHLMMTTMAKIRTGLDALTPDKDHGVIGRSVYVYGEAWDFGEVAGNQRGRNAAQMNLAGSGLGAFNDRLRDGAMGGGPFAPPQFQGLVTGLALAPNPAAAQAGQGGPDAARAELLVLSDWARSALAGNLRAYPLHLCDGSTRPGEQVLAHGLPLAYGGLPCEHVAFIGCHDNKTQFDQILEKASVNESSEERMRMAAMCLALITLSQGVPFIHAGDDLLRSKSLDRDSYNSGDWFNRIDWTGATNGFGSGLPVSTKNGGSWSYMGPLLREAGRLTPSAEQMRTATALFQAMLRVRYSSPLFRLAATADVIRQLAFHNTGPDQNPGVIVMELTSAPAPGDPSHGVYDPKHERLVTVFNCAPYANDVPYPPNAARLQLHADLAAVGDSRLAGATADEGSRTLRVPSRTAAVFVQARQ